MQRHASQNETGEGAPCLVLLGASNLALALPSIVSTAPMLFGPRFNLAGAVGFGRSYGKKTKFFLKNFSGILESKIWDAQALRDACEVKAIVADVGNDLAYGADVETIAAWVCTALDRLEQRRAQVAMNSLPVDAIQRVGGVRFAALQKIFFPGCRLNRRELIDRAVRLNALLERIAKSRNIPIFPVDSSWYGWDPIHPRRRDAWRMWSRMLAALTDQRELVPEVRPTSRLRGRCWRWVHLRRSDKDAQIASSTPVARLSDDAALWLF